MAGSSARARQSASKISGRQGHYVLAAVLSLISIGSAISTVAGQFGAIDWRLDLLSHFSFHYFLLLVGAGVLLLAIRFSKLAALSLIFAIGHFSIVGPFLVPILDLNEPTGGEPLSILQFNVSQSNQRYDSLVAYIRERAPDLVVLLETDHAWVGNLEILREEYPHSYSLPRTDYTGMAVYSKHPLKDATTLNLGKEGRPSLEMTVNLIAQDVLLFVTHPLPPIDAEHSMLRDDQIAAVAAHIGTKHGRRVLIADLNITPWSPIYRRLEDRTHMVNCSRGMGIHGTWPTTSNLVRIPIDNCIRSKEIRVDEVQVGPDLGSDHFPLELRLVI